MNIAILFVGQQRWFDLTNETYINNFMPFLQGHDVKYFAHFWECANQKLDTTVNKNGLEKFKEIHTPLIMETEEQKSTKEMYDFFKMKKEIHNSLMSQTYSFYKAFLLLEEYQEKNNMKFDVYIKLRTDLAFISKVEIEDFDSTSVYTKDLGGWRPSSNYIHDFMFFTKDYDNVKILAYMGFSFDYILDCPENFLYTDSVNNLICPEEVLARHYVNNNVEYKPYNFKVDLARNVGHSFILSDIQK